MPQPGPRKPSKELPKTNAIAGPVNNELKRVTPRESQTPAPPAVPKKNHSGEYGRLFVKVVKLKDLELPLPKGA